MSIKYRHMCFLFYSLSRVLFLLLVELVFDRVERTDLAVPARLDSAEFGGALTCDRPSWTNEIDLKEIVFSLPVEVAMAAEPWELLDPLETIELRLVDNLAELAGEEILEGVGILNPPAAKESSSSRPNSGCRSRILPMLLSVSFDSSRRALIRASAWTKSEEYWSPSAFFLMSFSSFESRSETRFTRSSLFSTSFWS